MEEVTAIKDWAMLVAILAWAGVIDPRISFLTVALLSTLVWFVN